MRLFIAIDLEKEAKDYLKSIQDKIAEYNLNCNFTYNYHLTLKFLGNVEDKDIETIKTKLSEINLKKFSAIISGVGIFSKRSNPKVIWSGIKAEAAIDGLQKEIENKLSSMTFEKDRDNFKPHISLCKIKDKTNRGKLVHFIKDIKKQEIGFNVTSFVLYQSTLTQQGPIYNVIEKFTLHD